ncbi:ATP-binding cassette domain-containing protein [Streptosporangium sp. NBC_01755]|nr:ATP-binding cassette domain-containing protein [Streptosporangium sp. NBC_01810]WSA28183.1 ATP-binding cassette domain-containing protein [Streptosporangium sp. NBC_01810]WSD00341.1 ATP-binding cassette domain-containing protein [Streptosporangium sp. NBC_01755]
MLPPLIVRSKSPIDILCGQNRQDGGTIRLDGRVLSGRPGRRSRMGLARTFQQPQVADDLTLAENISVGLAGRELPGLLRILSRMGRDLFLPARRLDPRVRAAAESVGLEQLDRLVGGVSFGEMRLVEVARALVAEPALMILDEPFPGVGDRGLESTLAALRGLREAGHSVLLVDHNIDVVLDLADQVSLLANGRIAFEGTPEACRSSQVFRNVYLGEVPA